MSKSIFIKIVGVLALLALVNLSPVESKAADNCPLNNSCKLPDCRCSSATIPDQLTPVNTPQIVYLTFDDAITISNYPFYEEVLFDRKNPNNASIKGTFFVTHEYTNYSMVHQMHRRGHEIALHSISHSTTTTYWATMNQTMWEREFVDQREQISNFANIPIADVKGMRAPFLQIGGDRMYSALSSGGFDWECSRPCYNQRKPGLWPYTNDYASTQDCQIAPCPVDAYPGFWTIPMVDFIGDDQFPCALVDECTPIPRTQASTYNLLLRNFNDQYNGNRAPFGVFTHAAWLVGPADRPEFAARKAGYIQFLDYLATKRDVFIVSISQALEWIRKPTPIALINDFEPWKEVPLKPNSCLFPRNCFYSNSTWERYMSSCVSCPAEYPWLGNHLGGITL